MKIAGISDNHLVYEKPVGRIDNIVETQWEKMDFVYNYCSNNDIHVVLGAGDMFDVKRSWGLLTRATEFFNKQTQETYSVVGQHDSYFHSIAEKSTIFGVLKFAGLIQQLTKNPVMFGDVHIYGCSWEESVPEPQKALSRINILVIHAPISIKATYGSKYLAKKFLDEHYYDIILCGDIHNQFIYKNQGRIICNTGPMLRIESTEEMYNHEPCFFVFDTDKVSVERIVIPHKPAGEVLTREHLDRKEYRKELLDKFVDGIEGDVQSVKFEENLNLYLKQNQIREGIKEALIETNPEMRDKI